MVNACAHGALADAAASAGIPRQRTASRMVLLAALKTVPCQEVFASVVCAIVKQVTLVPAVKSKYLLLHATGWVCTLQRTSLAFARVAMVVLSVGVLSQLPALMSAVGMASVSPLLVFVTVI